MWGPLHCTCRTLGVSLTLIKLASLFVWIRKPIQGCGGGLLGSCEMPCWRREGRILGIWNCASWKQMYLSVGGAWSHFGQCLSGNMHWCCRQRRQMSFTLGDWWEIVALMASQGCQVFSVQNSHLRRMVDWLVSELSKIQSLKTCCFTGNTPLLLAAKAWSLSRPINS